MDKPTLIHMQPIRRRTLNRVLIIYFFFFIVIPFLCAHHCGTADRMAELNEKERIFVDNLILMNKK